MLVNTNYVRNALFLRKPRIRNFYDSNFIDITLSSCIITKKPKSTKNRGIREVRFTICVICKGNVITFNCKDGICKDCWDKIEDGQEPTFTAYMKLDTSLEVFPKQRGRFLT